MTILHKGADVRKKIGQPKFLQDSLNNFVLEPFEPEHTIDLTVSQEVAPTENAIAEVNLTDVAIEPIEPETEASSTAGINDEIMAMIEPKNDEADLSILPTSEIVRPLLILPIAGLTPYRNKWRIKVRVTSKSTIKSWKNAKGEGRLFNFDTMDASGEIHCVAYREAVDRLYELIQVRIKYNTYNN